MTVEPARRNIWAQDLLVRFLALYIALYCVTTIQLLPFVEAIQAPLVSWIGRQVFGVEAVLRQTGSGDTTFHYVQVATLAMLALAGSLGWSLAARSPRVDERLLGWLRLLLRFTLLIAMVAYGSSKAIKAQFPDPLLTQLVQPLGEMSPMVRSLRLS